MTRTLHDIRCLHCNAVRENTVIENHIYPRCEECGGETTWIPSALHTDMFPTPQYSDASGLVHSSQREKEAHMKSLGYYGKGDKEHGARVDLSIKGTGFSYAGQGAKTSTGERTRVRAR